MLLPMKVNARAVVHALPAQSVLKRRRLEKWLSKVVSWCRRSGGVPLEGRDRLPQPATPGTLSQIELQSSEHCEVCIVGFLRFSIPASIYSWTERLLCPDARMCPVLPTFGQSHLSRQPPRCLCFQVSCARTARGHAGATVAPRCPCFSPWNAQVHKYVQ